MKSKRAALFLAIGGLIGCGSLSATSAADRFVSDAGYQAASAPMVDSQVVPVGFAAGGACDTMDCGCDTPDCGCDVAACDTGCTTGCDDACGGMLPGMFDCDLGDPFTLFGEACGYSVGGWVQTGYHTKALPLFNSRPEEFQLHQAWLYAEKAMDTTNGLDFGGRIDYVYGTDGPDTQAFGINNDHWDNDWDNGGDYGHALPQVYGEVGYGDISIKAGHFFTIIGYEVVAAPDNFFYSHAYTMYNSEPFTHTGVLATANVSDDLTVYGGYVLGWDSGFEDNGDSFLGGASLGLSDDITVTYATVGGRFGETVDGGERGYMHSLVTDVAVTDQLQYVSQSDLLQSEDAFGNVVRDTFGINNYLIYTVSDCLAYGARFEWWSVGADSTGFVGDDADLAGLQTLFGNGFDPTDERVNVFALTLGVNYKPHSNVVIRPEIRWDWISNNEYAVLADTPTLEDGDDSQTTFGIDSIILF